MAPRTEQAPERRQVRNPIERLGLPHGWTVALDWIVTIVGAVAIVLAIKAWVVNPYRIPTSSMEPRLHCARPGPGCLARFSDRVLANRFIYHVREPQRGDIVVFNTPAAAEEHCPPAGTFVKRIIGLPGETWEQRDGDVFINGRRLMEPYIPREREDFGTYDRRLIPPGHYFVMGDNRTQSCDSRTWGVVPRKNLIGKVFATYWPPNRISFR
jgi:signal peptidase I